MRPNPCSTMQWFTRCSGAICYNMRFMQIVIIIMSKTQPPFEISHVSFFCKHLHLHRMKTIERLKKHCTMPLRQVFCWIYLLLNIRTVTPLLNSDWMPIESLRLYDRNSSPARCKKKKNSKSSKWSCGNCLNTLKILQFVNSAACATAPCN